MATLFFVTPISLFYRQHAHILLQIMFFAQR